jgi:hypothetical protein
MTTREMHHNLVKKEHSQVIIEIPEAGDEIAEKFRRNIPQQLKNFPQWLLCKVVPVSEKAKPKKLPCTLNAYQTTNRKSGKKLALVAGEVADPLDFRSFGAFDSAVQLLERGRHQLLGFVLTATAGIKVIDMDDVLREDGSGRFSFYSSQAQEIYTAAMEYGAFVQLSVSRRGLHIFVTGSCSPKETITLSDHGGVIEIFSSNRFIAMTADSVGETPGGLVDGAQLLKLVRRSGTRKEVDSAKFDSGDGLSSEIPEYLMSLGKVDPGIWYSGITNARVQVAVTPKVVKLVTEHLGALNNVQIADEAFYKNLTRCIAELRRTCEVEELRVQLANAWDDRCKQAPSYDEEGNFADLRRFDREAESGNNKVGPFWLARQVGRETEFYSILNSEENSRTTEPSVRDITAKAVYPLAALGPVLGKAAEGIAVGVQAPTAMAANAILANAGFVCQSVCNVGLDGRVMPLSLFTITVAESGDRKSACDQVAGSAVLSYQKDLVDNYRDQLVEYRNSKAVNEQARRQALRKVSGAGQLEVLDSLPEPEPPIDPHCIAQEPTLEGLQRSLRLGLPSQILNNDEGGQFFGGHAMNPENRVKTIAGLSKFWDGSPISRTRAAAGESVMMFNRRLSIHLQMQPIIADSVLSDQLLMQQGILARFLIADCDSLAGTRFYTGLDAKQHPGIRKFSITSLMLLSHNCETDAGGGLVLPTKLLSAGAKAIWVHEYNRTEAELGAGGALEIIKPFAAKAAENALRLAAVFSVYETDGSVTERACALISTAQMRRAWQVIRYYMQVILRRTQLGEVKEIDQQALEVLEWLRGRGGKACIAEMQKYLPRRQHRKSVGHIRTVMAKLVAGKVVREVSLNSRGDPDEWEVI